MKTTIRKALLKVPKITAIFYFPSVLAAFSAMLIAGGPWGLSELLIYPFIGPFMTLLILPILLFLMLPFLLIPFMLVLWIILFIYAIIVKGKINSEKQLSKAGRYRLISFIWAIVTFLILLFLMKGPIFLI